MLGMEGSCQSASRYLLKIFIEANSEVQSPLLTSGEVIITPIHELLNMCASLTQKD